MSIIRSFQRTIVVAFLGMIFAIAMAAYFAINQLVAEQSRIQIQAVSPVFALIVEDIIKPLHLARLMASSPEMIRLLDAKETDQAAMVSFLQSLESQFDLTFFAASDRSLRQYHANGDNFALDDNIEWYHRIKASGKELVADLGKREDVHLYIDVAIKNHQGEFLGFVGVGKSLKSFWQDFQTHKTVHGYDMIFVDSGHKILLSSKLELMGYQKAAINIDQLPWY